MPKSTFIDFRAVKREVTMVQVLEHYGLMSRMKQNGDSITGACPIHEGKNETAFRVSISKNCWNCFSRCGCGGNVLDFVVKKEKVSLPKAARLLVEWFNLKIESPENGSPRREKSDSPVRDKNESKREAAKAVKQEDEKGENMPLGFVLQNLQPEHPYLTERGLSPETIQTFGLGFCQKGLLNGRIAIPIHNATAELVAYAGRWPGDTDKEKYLLPKGFKKSLELFNLDRASKEPADKPLVIVEGFFDCMMLHQHGCRKAIALMGSSLSPTQEGLIRKHTNGSSHVIVMLDEDEAGQAAREEIAGRLAKFCFVKVHLFEEPGMQPEHLSFEEVQDLIGGAS
ncbi:MAG TPA: CHC2 zinc finger domain-containing protein [Verrucomicrobiae bacterium]|nr:CHC2 zinc finger domain-containing protein [Verrucomicrobiae bacterium]